MNTTVTASAQGLTGIASLGKELDIETLLLAVQMERARLIDTQLAAKIEGVKARNDQIAKLNNVLSALTAVSNAFPNDAKADTKLSKDETGSRSTLTAEINLNDAIKAAGLTDLGFKHKSDEVCQDSSGYIAAGSNAVNCRTTKGEIDSAIQNVKGQLDLLNNVSQMDMLELQSLTNKRNDAYDLMTNFVKKMADSRSSILANMR